MQNKINIQLTMQQCNLIAEALDTFSESNGLKPALKAEITDLFVLFDTLSDTTTVETPRLQLVYDRDSNIRPLFPR